MIYSESNSWLSAQNKAALGAGGNRRREAQGGPGGQQGQNQGNGNGNGQNGYQHPSQGSGSSSTAPSGPSSTSSIGSPTQSASSGAASSSAANVNNLWPGNYTIWHPQAVNLAGSGQFWNAPSFYTMNGYIFSNNPVYQMCLSEKVIWYVNAYGGASHVFHMHGNGFKYHGFNEYAMSVNDGVGKTLYMDAVGLGRWQVICH
ncbi:hypothetical protein LTR48_008607, partial [Friedmanniomyces endolithicus]